ncbi:arginine--tRNA ligase, partial [Salmonella enterica subsp. enterica serovar Typhimurium]|uniref:hypothetical protein n=1 Tax=Salmonella enterica TaxID=28901 RepID=UPI000CBAB9DB
MDYKQRIADDLSTQLSEHLTNDTIYDLLEKPKNEEHGDVAFPAFQLAKIFKQNPEEIAQEIADKFSSDIVA